MNATAAAPNCCPHCGNDEYFVRMAMRGVTEYHRRFDGKQGADNSHIHDSLNYVEGKVQYCNRCKKRVGKAIGAKEQTK
jgi:hypothetical protein